MTRLIVPHLLLASFGVVALVPTRSRAQGMTSPSASSEVVRRTPGDSIDNGYRAYLPSGRARAMLVLLPGYPADVNSFEPNGTESSTLPARLAASGIATIVAVTTSQTLYADEAPLHRLDSLVAEARARYAVPNAPVAVGGFSAGGTGAVRFAERCAANACGGNAPVAALFAVDAPLDFARIWRVDTLSVLRHGPRANDVESRMVLADLRRSLGGAPDAFAAAYRRSSPLLATEIDGGNARWLLGTPVRMYTEPDVQWWIENRNRDYGDMNATDLAALINILRIGGNGRATLVTTTGRGVRSNGARHPHSWSIVDEAELADWLVRTLTADTAR